MNFLGLPTVIHELIFSSFQTDVSDHPSFLALRICCKQLAIAGSNAIRRIKFSIDDLKRVSILISKLPSVWAFTITKAHMCSFDYSLFRLSKTVTRGQLTYLSLLGIQQPCVVPQNPNARIDLASLRTPLDIAVIFLPWCSKVSHLTLANVDCTINCCRKPCISETEDCSCFSVLSQLSALVSLVLHRTSPPLFLNHVAEWTQLRKLHCIDCVSETEVVIPSWPLLEDLDISQNDIRQLDISGCRNLQNFNCSGNSIAILIIAGCTSLKVLKCSRNKIVSLDVALCTIMQHLDCSNCQVSNLLLPLGVKLQYLDCSMNRMTSLNLSHASGLQSLKCSHNFLPILDLVENHELISLSCCHNKLSILSLPHAPALKILNCSGNSELALLDLSANTNLEILVCCENAIAALDLSNNPKLQFLGCGRNNIRILNLPQSSLLKYLDCSRNLLKQLDVSSHKGLLRLHCQHNILQHLNLEGCEAITVLDCSHNNILDANIRKFLALQHFFAVYRRESLSSNPWLG